MLLKDYYEQGSGKEEPIEIAEGVFWLGFLEENRGLHCNPYLIVDNDEAIIIDGGSRTDFSTVMMKILQTGLNPEQVTTLLYHHYDPDLCSSIIHFEDIIKNKNLRIISHRENNVFIRYYGHTTPIQCIETLNYTYTFTSGRTLKFIKTPYAHSTGSFVTFDEKTNILFSSDLFGTIGEKYWSLIFKIPDKCKTCRIYSTCESESNKPCRLYSMMNFHKRIMPSSKSLKYAMQQIENLPIEMIAPQHGSIVKNKNDVEFLIKLLKNMENVGIEKYL